MRPPKRSLATGVLLAGAVLASSAGAQTPTTSITPQLTPQLKSITVQPDRRITAGATARGTVTLSKAAPFGVKVGLQLSGASPQDGLVGVQISGGIVTVPTSVTIAAGSDRASFDVSTVASGTWAGTKQFSVSAMYGQQTVSTSFTVSR